MAFNSNANNTLEKPSIIFQVNDWNSINYLNSPTIHAQMNSWYLTQNTNNPIISFSVDVISPFAVSYTTRHPKINAQIIESVEFTLTRLLSLPQLTFSLTVEDYYALTTNLPKPTLSFFSTANAPLSLNRTLPRPRLVYNSIFGFIATHQTWVLNTITDAHSRYTNYHFNSYFKIGNKNYGIKSDGIYEITGDYDVYRDVYLVNTNINIDASVSLPLTNFDEQQLKMCSDAFAYCRTTGDLEVVVTTDEQYQVEGLFIYDDTRTGMHRKRVKIPRGLKGNSWQYTIKNVDSSDFGINAFEVMVKTLQRVTW